MPASSAAWSPGSRWIPRPARCRWASRSSCRHSPGISPTPARGPSHGWEFFTCYNSEMAYDSLEVKASQNEMDFIAAVDWRAAQKAVDEGKATMVGGAPMLDPARVKG